MRLFCYAFVRIVKAKVIGFTYVQSLFVFTYAVNEKIKTILFYEHKLAVATTIIILEFSEMKYK